MPRTLAPLACLCIALGTPAAADPVRLIFDTDLESDVDDVGALAVLHALADRGECTVLATVLSTANPDSVPCLDALNTWYGRPDLPIGVPAGDAPDRRSHYAEFLADEYPHDLRAASDAPDAVAVYRRVLAAQPDGSVTVCTVGYLTNLAALLDSPPDDLSPLPGRELVARKVRRAVVMGGRYPAETDRAVNGNFKPDVPAARRVFADWPTPVLFTPGGEFAWRYATGGPLPECAPPDSPVRRAYARFFERSSWSKGPVHHSADPIAVLVAVRGAEPSFGVEPAGRNTLDRFGRTRWESAPDDPRHRLLTAALPPARVTAVMDGLMCGGPADDGTP